MRSPSSIEMLMSEVTKQPNGCWVHSREPGTHGYPMIGMQCLHRISWVLHNGAIPDGLWVLHNCNNKLCVNPGHLRLGTHIENMDDVAKVGHPRRKLTSTQAAEIRASAKPQRVLAREHGVSQRVIYHIKHGITYRYDTGD